MDFSDISEFEDLMTTSSDEDIPALDPLDTEAYGLWIANELLYLICPYNVDISIYYVTLP